MYYQILKDIADILKNNDYTGFTSIDEALKIRLYLNFENLSNEELEDLKIKIYDSYNEAITISKILENISDIKKYTNIQNAIMDIFDSEQLRRKILNNKL